MIAPTKRRRLKQAYRKATIVRAIRLHWAIEDFSEYELGALLNHKISIE